MKAAARKTTNPPPKTRRAAQKKEALIAAATDILNHHGIRGVSLADVAARIGLIKTSVTYYFKRKEDLVAACVLDGIARLNTLISDATKAAGEAGTEQRVQHFVGLYLELMRRAQTGEAPPLMNFSVIRTLKAPYLEEVSAAYVAMFKRMRVLVDLSEPEPLQREDRIARTLLLLNVISWIPAWIHRYELDDYPRVGERLADILLNGLMAAAHAKWSPPGPLAFTASDAQQGAQETFLIAATQLFNEQGYRGASVDKISARLNVTKGAFYHHNEAKDTLVLQCFERTFEIVRRVQRAAADLPGNSWDKLAAACVALAEFQLSDKGPLLRSSAFSALPKDMALKTLRTSDSLSNRFAAMISDGIADGSIRPVDPVIASQTITAGINAVADLPIWVPGIQARDVGALYIRPMLLGLCAR